MHFLPGHNVARDVPISVDLITVWGQGPGTGALEIFARAVFAKDGLTIILYVAHAASTSRYRNRIAESA